MHTCPGLNPLAECCVAQLYTDVSKQKEFRMFKKIWGVLAAVGNWWIQTQQLRTRMILQREGVRFDSDGNVVGYNRHVL
jgi:hypothetical protein